MTQSEDSLVQQFQKLYESEYGRAVSLHEAEIILNALGDLLLLADVSEGVNDPP